MLWGSQRESRDWSTSGRIRLGMLGLLTPEKRGKKGDLIAILPSPEGRIGKFRLYRRAWWTEEVTVASCKESSTGYEEKIHHEGEQCKNRLPRESGYLCSWRFLNFSWEYLWASCSGTEVGPTLSRSWTKTLQRIPLTYILIIFWECTRASCWRWK